MDINEWYENDKVKEMIVPHLKFRESAVISKSNDKVTMRYLNLFNTRSLEIMYKYIKFLTPDKKYNLYSSLARFGQGGFKVMGFWGARRNEMVEEIKKGENYVKNIIAMDFAIDIDAPSHEYIKDAFFSAQQVKKLFDTLNVPYSLRFSGCGFHFVIPSEYFKHDKSYDGYNEDNIYKVYRAIADSLYHEFSEFIDTTIYDMKRVLKVPYSLAVYQDVTYVCWEFMSNEDFEDFKLEDMTPETKYKQLNTLKPGIHIFNKYGTVDKLLSRYGVKL